MNNRPLILLATLLMACYKEEDFDRLEIEPDDVIEQLLSNEDSLLANNADKTMITVVLPDDAKEDLDIALTTSQGVFTSNNSAQVTVKSKIVSRDGVAKVIGEAELKNSNMEGTITINATVSGYARSHTIISVHNPPNALSLTPSSLTISHGPSAEVEISVQLSAASGAVTQGHPVELVVYDASYAAAIGSFRIAEPLSDANGKARFIYSLLPDTTYLGVLHAVGGTEGMSTTLRDTLDLYAID